jgi:hypothetical protein
VYGPPTLNCIPAVVCNLNNQILPLEDSSGHQEYKRLTRDHIVFTDDQPPAVEQLWLIYHRWITVSSISQGGRDLFTWPQIIPTGQTVICGILRPLQQYRRLDIIARHIGGPKQSPFRPDPCQCTICCNRTSRTRITRENLSEANHEKPYRNYTMRDGYLFHQISNSRTSSCSSMSSNKSRTDE